MADKKISQLNAMAVVTADDLLVVVDSPGVTPETKKITAGDLGVVYPSQAVCGRLTLSTGVPVPIADVTAATVVYFTPYRGNRVPLYDTLNSRWKVYAFAELSITLTGLPANTSHDVFLYDNAGVLTLELVAWTSNSLRATAIVLQDGLYVKSGAAGRLYLGTIRTTATIGQCEDSAVRRFVWNFFNQLDRTLKCAELTYHTYGGVARLWNNASTNNQLEFVLGLAATLVSEITAIILAASANPARVYQYVNGSQIGVDAYNAAANYIRVTAVAYENVALGYNLLQAYEVTNPATPVASFAEMGINALIKG